MASAMSIIAVLQACADGAPKPALVGESPPPVPVPAPVPAPVPQAKSLRLQGSVSDAARLKGAEVVVTAAATAYTTTVAANGSYLVTLKNYAADDFVTVRIQGLGNASALEFFSLAGTAGALETLGGNDGSVDSVQADRLQLSSIDTARAGLIALRKAQAAEARVGTVAKVDNPNASVQSDDELQDAEAGLDPQEVNQVATLIQVVADHPQVPPPESGTYRFAQQSGAQRADYTAEVQRDFPQQVEQSSTKIAASEAPPLTEADVPPQLLIATTGPNEKSSGIVIFYRFNADKTGSLGLSASTGTSRERTFTWQVSDNSLRVSFPAFAAKQPRDVDGDGDRFEENEVIDANTKEDHQLFFGQKDANGITTITYKQRRQISFPNKEVPDEDFTLTRVGPGVNDRAPSVAALHFSASELNGRTLAMDSSSRLDAAAIPTNAFFLTIEAITRRGDELTFNTGGSGRSLVLGSFAWSIGDGANGNPQGELKVEYPNGEIARYAKLKALPDGVQLVRRYFDSPSSNSGPAYRIVTAGLMLEVDAAAKLDATQLAGVYHFNGVGSSGASEVHSSITWQLDAADESVETLGSSFKLSIQPGGELTYSSSPIHDYSLSADGRRLLAVSTSDTQSNPGCDLASDSNCQVTNHRELHILKRVGNNLYVRLHETTPTTQDSPGRRDILSSILLITVEPAANQGPAKPISERGFVSADEIAAAYAIAEFSADGDFIDSITPSPRDSTLAYPSSGNCSAGGSFTATADGSTAFNQDGLLSGNNCQTRDADGGVALLNGQIATQCVDPAQTDTACQQFNASYGSASQRLNAVASDGDYLSSLFLNVRSRSASNDFTRIFNGDVQTRPDGAAQGATLTLNYANFEGSYRDTGLVVAGSLSISSSNPANCYAGKATYTTNTPVSQDSLSGPGNVRVRDVNGGAGTVVFQSDGRVAVLFEGATKTYTREQLSNFCN